MQENEDSELMARIAEGDHQAFQALVARHLPRTVRLAARIGGESDAEDIAQEAFAKLWTYAPQYQRKGAKFTTWFYRVVVNLSIDFRRKKRGITLESLPEIEDSGDDALQQIEKKAQSQRVAKAISGLPARQRTALVLCHYEGYSNAQAADIMGVGIKAVESLLVRARQQLRKVLKHERR